jgi:hypothetical protein
VKLSSSRLEPLPALLSRPEHTVRIGRVAEKILLWACVLICLMVISRVAGAQERYPIETAGEGQTGSKYTQQLAIDVADVPGHQVRVVELMRTYSDETKLRIMGTPVKEAWLRGLTDYVSGSGPARGYTVWVLADGERIFLQWDSVSQSEPTASGSRRGSSEAVTRITGGTGKYKGIRGLMRDTVQFDTDPQKGYSKGSTKGEYWFVE